MTWAIDQKGYSQRRAYGLIGIAPKTYRYVTARGDDSEFRERLRRLAGERRRFGYRRLHILLRREGIKLNHKKLFRIYREERLTVRRRGGRKRALGTRAQMTLPQGANSAIASTSPLTCWPTGAAFGCSSLSTISPANAWRWSSTRQSPIDGSRASSMPSSRSAASR